MAKQSLSSDHFLEIRYEPFGGFLNIRGTVADSIRREGLFKQWLIGDNRVDFWNAEDQEKDPEKAWASFLNCGYVVRNPATEHYFADRAGKYVSVISAIEGFSFPTILRMGVRSRFYVCLPGATFETVRARYSEKFVNPQALRSLDGQLDDVGVSLNYKEDKVSVRTQSGPMRKEQYLQQVQPAVSGDEISDVGLFFDMDFFILDVEKPDVKAMLGQIKIFHRRCWEGLASMKKFLGVTGDGLEKA